LAPETDLKDKVVLITGASAGIGRACVWRFAEKGARLVLVARRADKLAELRNDLLAEFPTLHVHIVPMSVTDTDAVDALPAALPAPFRDVYCLVNNAGLALGVSPVDKNVVADAKTMLDANVLGTIAFCSAFIPGMKARGAGHVVNMGSCAGKYAYANGTVYNASKVRARRSAPLHRPLLPILYNTQYAVHGFTEAARHDLGPTPIRVTHIAPGLVGGTEFSLVRLGDASKYVTPISSPRLSLPLLVYRPTHRTAPHRCAMGGCLQGAGGVRGHRGPAARGRGGQRVVRRHAPRARPGRSLARSPEVPGRPPPPPPPPRSPRPACSPCRWRTS
jgi:NADP-dependent 3-hydroxy acid dehydrogenase YdfG